MFDRSAKEELAVLLPNTMPDYLRPATDPAAGNSDRWNGLVARLGGALNRLADLPRRFASGGRTEQTAGS